MRLAFLTCLLIFEPFGAAMADTQRLNPIPGFAPRSIPFDIPGGQFDQWSKYLPCEANFATFKVDILRSHVNPQWNSQVRVSVSNNPVDQHNSKPAERNAFEWIALTLVSDVNGIASVKSASAIEQHKDGKTVRGMRLHDEIKNNQEYRIRLRWGTEGEVSASIDGGQEVELKMGKRVTTLNLYASGVKAEFRDLQIGRLGPKPEGRYACAVS